jgi:HK97 family phage major capsid protein
MRQISRVITTNSGEALQSRRCPRTAPLVDGGERGVHGVGRGVRQATLNAYKAATLIKVSEELLQDSAFDLEAFIRDQFGQRIGVLENTAYVVGDGSGKPTGVTTQASAGVTAAGAAAITADELIDLFHSLARRTAATRCSCSTTARSSSSAS